MWQYFNQIWPHYGSSRMSGTSHLSVTQSQVSRLGSFYSPQRAVTAPRLSHGIERGVFVAVCKLQVFRTHAGFHKESICLWHSSYTQLYPQHKILKLQSFVWGPADRSAAEYSQRKAKGEYCRLLVNLCSEEIVHSINSMWSENLDLLRNYILCKTSFSTVPWPWEQSNRSSVSI